MGHSDRELEDRIFELLGEMKTPLVIVRELGLELDEGYALVAKVIRERDTPNQIAIREGIERMVASRKRQEQRRWWRMGLRRLLQWDHQGKEVVRS